MGILSVATAQLLAHKPLHWEYLLFDYCLSEAIDQQLTVPCLMPTVEERAGSKYTFYLNGPIEGQRFADWSTARVSEFCDAMKEAVQFSAVDTTECFGPPGVPGNPELIAALAKHFARKIQVVRQKAFEFACMRVVCDDTQLQITADLYMRSCLRFFIDNRRRNIDFVRSIGVRILEALEVSDGKVNLVFETSKFQVTLQPLLYQLSKVAKPVRQAQTYKTIAKPSIHVTFIDTETTGLDFADEPISIGAVKYEVDSESGALIRLIDTYYELREPTVPVGESAFRVHGIGTHELRGKHWDMDRVHTIIRADMLIAHNAEFDRSMLAKLMKVDTKLWACSMKDITDLWGRRSWTSLNDLAARFDLERPWPHNALKDAQTLAQVVAQPLPKSEIQKTILWEMIRRHYGFEPLVFNGDDYIVWGHYSRDGTLLYVRTARPGEPDGSDDFFLSYYAKKYLPDGCIVLPIKADLTFDQAIEAKDELLKNYHGTLLNIRNIYRPPNPINPLSNGEFHALLDKGKSLENCDAEASVLCYSSALFIVLDRGYQPSESGLIGQVQNEINQANMQMEKMLLKPLDRISLLLCRQGEPAQAKAVFESVKAKFPTVDVLPGALPILKRIETALKKFAPNKIK